MADKWLKLTYKVYVSAAPGATLAWLTSDLPNSAFPNANRRWDYYQGEANILLQGRLPGQLRLYQAIVKFDDRVLLDNVMNPTSNNRLVFHSSPDDIPEIYFKSTDGDTFTSDVGTEDSYVTQIYDRDLRQNVYTFFNEIDMYSIQSYSSTINSTVTCEHIYLFHDNETELYDALLEMYPNNVTPYNPNADPWSIDRTGLYLPYRTEFPEMYEYNGVSPWYIDNTGLNLPYHVEFPEMHDYYYEKPWYIDDTGENLPYREEFPDMPELPRRYTDPAPPSSWFSFKGQKCTEFGCILEKLPLNIRNELNTKIIDMPNNTPYVQDPSGWKTKVITVTLGLKNTSNATIDAINSWLIGQGELIFSDDPDRHYIATCNGTLTGNRLLRLGKLPVQFTLMPYKRNNEEDFIEYEPDENSAVFIENKGTAFCEPEIVIYGTGDIALAHTESGTVIHITGVTDQCTISVPKRKVFDENNNVILSQVSGDITELKLAPKTINEITFSSNVTKVEVKLNERWL